MKMLKLRLPIAVMLCCFAFAKAEEKPKKQHATETMPKSFSPALKTTTWKPSRPFLNRRYENGGEYYDNGGYSNEYQGHGYYVQPQYEGYEAESPRFRYGFYDPIGRAYVRVEVEQPIFHGRTFGRQLSSATGSHSGYQSNAGQSSAYNTASNPSYNANNAITASYGVSYGPVTTTTNSNGYGSYSASNVPQSNAYSSSLTNGYGSSSGSGYSGPASGSAADYYGYDPNGSYGSYGHYGVTDNPYAGYTNSGSNGYGPSASMYGYGTPPSASGYVGYGGTSNSHTNPVSYRSNSQREFRVPFFNENGKSLANHYKGGRNSGCNHH